MLHAPDLSDLRQSLDPRAMGTKDRADGGGRAVSPRGGAERLLGSSSPPARISICDAPAGPGPGLRRCVLPREPALSEPRPFRLSLPWHERLHVAARPEPDPGRGLSGLSALHGGRCGRRALPRLAAELDPQVGRESICGRWHVATATDGETHGYQRNEELFQEYLPAEMWIKHQSCRR